MINILFVMLGGGIGAVIRGFITNYCATKFTSPFPIATSFVNIIGSFFIGFIMGMTIHTSWIHPLLIIGVLGGLTTFSTLSSELVKMLVDKQNLWHFIGYSLLQYVVSFAACFIGYIIL